jgi:hypothetical protein
LINNFENMNKNMTNRSMWLIRSTVRLNKNVSMSYSTMFISLDLLFDVSIACKNLNNDFRIS